MVDFENFRSRSSYGKCNLVKKPIQIISSIITITTTTIINNNNKKN